MREVPGVDLFIELRTILWSEPSAPVIFPLSGGGCFKKKQMTGFFTILSSFGGMYGAISATACITG